MRALLSTSNASWLLSSCTAVVKSTGSMEAWFHAAVLPIWLGRPSGFDHQIATNASSRPFPSVCFSFSTALIVYWLYSQLKGKLFDSTIADEGTWTLEDRKMVRIVLTKTKRDAANCWTSLLESEYAADPWVQDQMQRKLTLERFQKENPGFDFSGAEISGNYTKGGPDFSNLEK
uniref:NudC domain containing 2 n=1 Tax=Equus caballus TaxID=9796 RepID=F7B1E3_HORSE